jgi:hypothetical protein
MTKIVSDSGQEVT